MIQDNQETKLLLIKDLGMIYPKENSKQKKIYGLYKCYCGNEFKAISQNVEKGNTKSCGCLKSIKSSQRIKDRCITHGLTNHRIYPTWNNMISRCNDKKANCYKNYGGRGISVCERWLDISKFIEDMYPTYQEGLTIDRIDVNGNYCKDNCRWTTKTIQSRNTRLICKHNTSGYRGVTFNKHRNKFMSQIMVNGKKIYLGLFIMAKDAAKAYDKYVIENNLEHTINGVL